MLPMRAFFANCSGTLMSRSPLSAIVEASCSQGACTIRHRHGRANRRGPDLAAARRTASASLVRDRRIRRPGSARRRGNHAGAWRAGAGPDGPLDRHPGRIRRPGPAALRAGAAGRHHLPEQPGHHRQRLPRRAGRDPRQSRAEAGDDKARRSHRPARRRASGARRAGRRQGAPSEPPRGRRIRTHGTPVTAPGPRGHPLLGSLPRARRNPLALFMDSFRDYGEVVRLRFGPMIAHLVSSPAGVAHVLAENNKNYGKQTRGYRNLRYVLGNGLLTSEGETWKRQRRIAQPAFHRQRIAGFATTMVRAAEDATAGLESRRGHEVDVHHEMMRLTLRIVGETLLAHDPTDAADEVGAALTFLLTLANDRTRRVFDLPPIFPTRQNLRFRRALATLDSVVLRMIADRRKNPADRGDLLSMLIAARDAETGESMDDRQLRDETMTIFLAGHETTANALTFAWLLLSRHPAAFRELRVELAQVLG